MDEFHRAPPYDESAEIAVLGSILIDPEKVLDLCSEHHVKAETFYIPANRTVFEAIQGVAGDGKIPDLVTLPSRMERDGTLEQAGGKMYIERLVEDTPTAAHAEHYIDEITNMQMKRTVIALGQEAESMAYDGDVKGKDAVVTMLDKFFAHASLRESAMTNSEALVKKIQEWKGAMCGVRSGLECFLPSLSKYLGDYKYGKLYFIGASPAGGKSTYMHNQARFWAVDQEIPCAINSIEMTHDELLGRVVGEMADVSTFAMDQGWAHGDLENGTTRIQKVMKSAKRLVDEDTDEMKAPLFIDDRQMNIDELCVWARLMVRKHGIKALMVDYVQILGAPKGFKGVDRERLDYIANKLRELAKSLDIVVLVLSQLSGEGGKGNKPSAYDLFGSKTMQHAAFGIIMLYRNEDEEHIVDVQKNRGGATGSAVVYFNKQRQRMEDVKQGNAEVNPGDFGIPLNEDPGAFDE